MIQPAEQRFPQMSFVGIDGVLVRFGAEMSEGANKAAVAFHRHVAELKLPGVLETAPSLTAVFIRLDIETDLEPVLANIRSELARKDWFAVPSAAHRKWTIPCCFDGPQLREAAELAGVSETQAVAQITQSEVQVLTLGFAPGQPYLGTLDQNWNIPRMTGIAAQVPARALVVAVSQLIVFANEAPTGWRHIGQMAFTCFDKDREVPFAFQSGDLVQFETAGRAEIDGLMDAPTGGARLERLA